MWVGCSEIPKPAKLISKDEMSDIMMETALYDNSTILNPNVNMEGTSKFILEKHKITGQQYVDSYNYYLANNNIEGIINNAQKKLLDKNPELKEYVDKLKKEEEERKKKEEKEKANANPNAPKVEEQAAPAP